MLSRIARPSTARIIGRTFSEAAAADSGNLVINFNLPHETIYDGKEVAQVIVPGVAGEYGVTAGHSAIVSQMKAGVLQIIHTDSPEPEKYFVPGGFALSHENSVTDITCPEAVKLDDIDSAAVTSNFNEAKRVYDGSEEGSEAKALAQIDMDVNRAMAQALGVTIA
ncbi:hypothetical protein TrRE_jg9479 [Triparma retinervis]|uniref:ATP synthase F1 complex delta/epsilon subunit N-terminal domain-containing protein n=1 Tax=Triparma retinervis TaxID=2557542 RepID=A0A9W7E4S4_9STRA|nr:hypothetical protein TrRE_jg9479 [Triparma retinervis]